MKVQILFLLVVVVSNLSSAILFGVNHEQSQGWRQLDNNSVSNDEEIKFTIQIKDQNMDRLREIVLAISDPKTEMYAAYMTFEEVDAITRPLPEHVALVTNWLSNHEGIEFRIDERSRNVRVKTNVKYGSRLLRTKFTRMQRIDDGRVVLRAHSFEVPDALSEAIQSIYGLHGLPLPRVPSLINTALGSTANVTPTVLASTYGIAGVNVTGGTAVRQAVAEFQRQYMDDDDLGAFFKNYVPSYTAGVDDKVYKFVGDPDEQSGQAEASLDIQYVMGVAPKLKTEFWLWSSMDFCGDLKNWTDAIRTDSDAPLVHSVSYGWQGDLSALQCTKDKVEAIDDAFVKLAVQGYTIIFASGDSGSGYSPPTVDCDARLANTELTGTVLKMLPYAYTVEMCCEILGNIGGKGYTVTYMSSDSTCEDGDVGTKDAAFVDGAGARHFVNVQEQECCNIAKTHPMMSAPYFSFLPTGGSYGNCTLYSSVTGETKFAKGAYSGKATMQEKLGNCTVFSEVTGSKASTVSISGKIASTDNATLWPSWPASSPYVTAIGATRFVGQAVGNEEMASDQFGSGGGFSSMFDQTDAKWQADAVKAYIDNPPNDSHYPPAGSFSATGRATPDVSALGEGYQIVMNGHALSIGGTSASAPAFAGMISLLNEARRQKSMNPMGFLNPFLYQNPDAFTDITLGTNAIGRGAEPLPYGFNCTKGWDPATGLGTPIFSKLLEAALEN